MLTQDTSVRFGDQKCSIESILADLHGKFPRGFNATQATLYLKPKLYHLPRVETEKGIIEYEHLYQAMARDGFLNAKTVPKGKYGRSFYSWK